MSSYMIVLIAGESIEVEADFYGDDGDDLVFTSGGEEVRRVPAASVVSVSRVK